MKPGSIVHHLKKAPTLIVPFPPGPQNTRQEHAVCCTVAAEGGQHNLVMHLQKLLASIQ